MRARFTSKGTTIDQVVKNLGVPKREVPAVAARVAAHNGLRPDQPPAVGQTIHLPDASFASAFDPTPGATFTIPIGPTPPSNGPPGKRMHGLQQDAKAKAAQRKVDLSSLQSLLAVVVPGLVNRATLHMDVDLPAGRHSLPLGHGRIARVNFLEDTKLQLWVSMKPGPKGPQIATAELTFDHPVEIVNPAEAVVPGFLGRIASGAAALGGVRMMVDGVTLKGDGTVLPHGKLTGPLSMETVTGLIPHVPTDVGGLVELYKDAAIDVTSLVAAVTALKGAGGFRFTAEGDAGVVHVDEAGVEVMGHEQQLVAELTGDFSTTRGTIGLSYQGKIAPPPGLPVSLQLEEPGSIGAKIGPVSVRTNSKGVQLRVDGKQLAIVNALADRFRIKLGPDVTARLDGALNFRGGARLSVEQQRVVLNSNDVQAVVRMPGTRVSSDAFDVLIGDGSILEMNVTEAHVADGQLVLEDARGGFAVSVTGGAGLRGISAALANPATLRGSFAVSGTPDDPQGLLDLTCSVHARATVLGVRLPKMGIEQSLLARITKDAVVFAMDNWFPWRLGL